jgi:SAM-dependent methyltransferase
MTSESAQAQDLAPYVGHDHLVAMREALNYNAMIERLLERWLWPYPTLLDIGAGLGEFALRMEGRGHQVMALEIDAAQRRRLETLGLVTRARIADVHEPVDAAYSLNVLEHIEDDVAALKDWSRVIVPGGSMFIYVPAFPLLYSPMDKAVGHYRRYTRASLTRVMRQAGLEVLRSGYADSLGFAAALAWRLRGGDGSLSPGTVRLYDRLIFPVSQLLDLGAGPFFGKNVWAVARIGRGGRP